MTRRYKHTIYFLTEWLDKSIKKEATSPTFFPAQLPPDIEEIYGKSRMHRPNADTTQPLIIGIIDDRNAVSGSVYFMEL